MTRPDALLVEHLIDRFNVLFGVPPRLLAWAPGRVNLIGDHTDYCEGFALPIAIDLHTVVAAAPSASGRDILRIASLQQSASLARPLALPVADAHRAVGDWSDYLRGVAAGYARLAGSLPALDVLIGGDLPLGAGLSSSASLELAFAMLLERSGAPSLSVDERIRLCQRAEHEFPGMPCGILDQYSVAMARTDTAMLLDCRAVTSVPVSIASDIAFALIDSGVRHALVDGGYEQRLHEARAAEARLACSLRDATEEDLGRLPDDTLRRRARHIISENTRVHAFADALAKRHWSDAGAIMFESHRSLAEDYAVSCPEVDELVDAARTAGAVGARMTGGGFGGAVICLVEAARQKDFEDALKYQMPRTKSPVAAPRWVRASSGAMAEALTAQ